VKQDHFILTVFDLELWCPVLETRFAVDDLLALRAIVEADIDTDPNFDWNYRIDANDLQAINQRFAVELEPRHWEFPNSEIWLKRDRSPGASTVAPYLIHTRFELPLMLDGRKKLARFTNESPTEAEAAFDKWVEKGLLHKEVFQKPIPELLKPYANDISHQAERGVSVRWNCSGKPPVIMAAGPSIMRGSKACFLATRIGRMIGGSKMPTRRGEGLAAFLYIVQSTPMDWSG